MNRTLPGAALIALISSAAVADDAVVGNETLFQSPNGTTERCVQIAPMPGARYSEAALATEALYCGIDLYAPTIGLCPKTWSTSPAMVIHDLSSGPFVGDREGFEATACVEGKDAKRSSGGEIVRIKPSMNDPRTSGTFSQSPLLYYHLSRFLGADVGVPPAVWRSMDRAMHLEEIAQPGVEIAQVRGSGPMMQAAWEIFVAAHANPDSYVPTDDVFVADRSAIYGTMLRNRGDDYGPEINGTSDADWGIEVYSAFQQTAPYLALRSDRPLAEAVAEGVAVAITDPQIAEAMGTDPNPRQIVFWMADLANVAVLDFVLNQQDRFGNIDYVDRWYWSEDGQLMSASKNAFDLASGNLPQGAMPLQRTHINDNDAGIRPEYHNFARESGMLDNLRHFPAGTYRQLMALDADLKVQVPLHAYLGTSFGLSEAAFGNLVANVALAADTLRAQCLAGTMQFDLDPAAFILSGAVAPGVIDCANP
ncbi:MAG: hypothetical protein P8N72_09840 [Flavimaricola sp.]|nr:hypothetical protein [Flavimaricola sp.]